MKYKNITMSVALALTAITPAFVVSEQVEASSVHFNDVSSSDYFAQAVESLASRGIVSGYQGKFSPNRDVTRGEAVKMLFGIINPNTLPAVNPPTFIDVNASHMFYKEIAYLSELKIINGTGGVQPKFNPDAKITREEMAIMISRAFELEDPELDESEFTDIREPYASAIRQLYAYGITNGLSRTHFGSKDNVTRGQIAVFLYRAEERDTAYTNNIYGEIQQVTDTYVQINQKKYTIPAAYKTLFSTKNARTLKGAEITAEVSGQNIYSIDSLYLTASSSKNSPLVLTGSEDEDWFEIDLTIGSPYVKLQNVDLGYVEVTDKSLEVDFNGYASHFYVMGYERENFKLTGTGHFFNMSQEIADHVDLQLNGSIEYYSFTDGNKSLTVSNYTDIEVLRTDYSKKVIEDRVTGLQNVKYFSIISSDDEDVYEDYYSIDEDGKWIHEKGRTEDEDSWAEEDDEEFIEDDSIVNPDYQGPFDGIIYAVEDGRMKVGKHWVTIKGDLNTFFNDNKDMLIGSHQQMRAFKGEVTAIQRLVIEKSGTVEFPYWNHYGLYVNALNIHADNVEVININATNFIYLGEEVETKFTYKDGESTGEFIIAGEDELNKSAVNADDLVLSFENVVVDDLTILQPNRQIEMGRNVYFNNLTVDVPTNPLKRYPTITMSAAYDELNFKTRFANLSGISSFLMSELSPASPVISGNAVIDELNVLKGNVDWQAKGMIHSLSSVKDGAVTIGPNVLIGATYDRFGDAVSGQFLVKNGAAHKAQLNVKLDDTNYFIPKMTLEYPGYGQYSVSIMKPENLKVVYRFGSIEEWEALQIGQQVNLGQFVTEDSYENHVYWHNQELMLVALDANNRIVSKQLYTHLQERDPAFQFKQVNNEVYIESVLTPSITSTDYLYYFVDDEMKIINDPSKLKWLNDSKSVNKIQLPEPMEKANEVRDMVGFIVTVNGEQQIHQLNESQDSNLRILPGLGRDLLKNKSEGSKMMTKHILEGMYKGSPYVPKGFEFEFVLKQYMADFSEEANLTMKRIGEIVVKHDKSDTTLKHIQHIQTVRSQMINIETRIQLMVKEGRQNAALETIEALREQVELVREEAIREEYTLTLDRLESTI